MIKGEPSRTALLTAVQRAHHYLTAAEPKILRDDLALKLSGLTSVEETQAYMDQMIALFTSLSDKETATIFMKNIDGTVCMRSRVVEEELSVARQEQDVAQLVILGAGLDTTAYRCKSLTDGLQVFEVDHPSTQAWKRERLASADIEIPDNVTFVAFDFENQTLAQALKAGGVKQDKVTFFTWLGVHMYLTDEAVRATFDVLGQYPKGSELVMDFMSPSYVEVTEITESSVADLQKVVSEMGEPMKSKYYEHELEDMLRDVGFNKVSFLTAKWLVDNYLGGDKTAFDMPDRTTTILTAKI